MSKRNEIEQAIESYVKSVIANEKDKGRFGKAIEVLARDAMLKKGIRSISDCKVRSIKQQDVRRNNADYEIKTGSGAVAYAETDGFGNPINPFTHEDFTEQNVLPKAKFVVWFPESQKAFEAENCFSLGYVFTREQFLACLVVMGKNGLPSMLALGHNGIQLQLQTLSEGKKKKMRAFIQTNEIPTLAKYLGD